MVGKSNAKGGGTTNYVTYGIAIDLLATNPLTMVTYTDDAVGMTKGSEDWWSTPIFSLLKSCILINGAVSAYLNESNLALLVGGGASDITTLGNDVMVELGGRIGYKITFDSYRILRVKITNNPNNPEFNYDAFSLDAYNDCDKIYWGVYEGFLDSNKLYSSSGRTISVSQTIATFRTDATARGAGYQQLTYPIVKLRQCLYLIFFGTLNSQSAVGMGFVHPSHTLPATTGGTNAYGRNSEIIKASNPTYMTDQNHQVKCMGTEDIWGNFYDFVDGVVTDASRNVLTCSLAKDFNSAGTGYVNNGNSGVASNIINYMSRPQGGSNAGFAASAVAGSDSTYFCDNSALYASSVCMYGGDISSGASSGIFLLYMLYPSTEAKNFVGARLTYLHKEV